MFAATAIVAENKRVCFCVVRCTKSRSGQPKISSTNTNATRANDIEATSKRRDSEGVRLTMMKVVKQDFLI